MPKPQSILDRDEFEDSDDDEIYILASQNAEEQERILNLERVQKANEMRTDLNYSAFLKPVASTSTQHRNRAQEPTGNTEQIRNNLFVDLTDEPHSLVPTNHFRELRTSRMLAAQQSSQKENFSASQTFNKQSNQALQIQLKTCKSNSADLREKLLVKEGEATNLRREKKALQEQLKQIQTSYSLQKLRDEEMNRDSLEIQRLTKEIQRLKNENGFKQFNQSSLRAAPAERLELMTKIPFFTKIPMKSTAQQTLEIPMETFDDNESLPKNIKSGIRAIVSKVQKRLARVHLRLISGVNVDDTTLNSLFIEASQMILEINKYVKRLESGKERKITFDSNFALRAYLELSAICLREKLTAFNHLKNALHKDQGIVSIYQPGTLFPEEICADPRRIIAFYASVARYSKKFSERILIDEIGEENGHRHTFATILRDLLVDYVSESDRVTDYIGFVMAAANLLASLAVHYDDFEILDAKIDATLVQIFRATLECRCDNPFVMHKLSEFLFNVTKNPQKNPRIASQLCVNFSKADIEFSNMYKYSSYPPEACSFQLFSMFLLNAFKSKEPLNGLELELLLRTTLNLNRITSNVQEMKVGTLRFLEQDEHQTIVCSCFSTLVNVILTLNHMVLFNRNVLTKYSIPKLYKSHLKLKKREDSHNIFWGTLLNSSFLDHSLTAELARSSVTMIHDLFKRLDNLEKNGTFPIEKLVFANKLECICKILKSEDCRDDNKNRLECFAVYKMDELNGKS